MASVVIIFSALCGFLLALFIHFKKRLHHPLVCPIGHSCDPVVHSDYSRFMDIPVEVLGVIYYTIVVIAYAASLMVPEFYSGMFGAVLLALSATAFLFSIYLTFVQAFILKEWCTWCLISAALCAIILFLSLKLGGFLM